jgi:histidine triad (HIT) family protein
LKQRGKILLQSHPSDRFDPSCAFCKIVREPGDHPVVYENESSLAFLDHRPLFPGHTLLIPKRHFAVIADLPEALLGPFFSTVKTLAAAIQHAMGAEGTFLGANNQVSQSVPHFHVHIVPRRKGDGLKGFFWPRQKYKSPEEIAEALQAIRSSIARLKQP